MSIIDQIHKLNEEIAFGAEMESKLRRFIKREDGSDLGQMVQLQLNDVTRRLDRAEREKAVLIRQAHEAISRRHEIAGYRRPLVRFYGLEVVQQ